jgi:hypothetical protein
VRAPGVSDGGLQQAGKDKRQPALRVLISRDAKARAQRRSEAAAGAFVTDVVGGGGGRLLSFTR